MVWQRESEMLVRQERGPGTDASSLFGKARNYFLWSGRADTCNKLSPDPLEPAFKLRVLKRSHS